MSATEKLDGLRASQDGVDAVLFADLSTKTVLAASSATKTGQERLDAVALEVSKGFDSPLMALAQGLGLSVSGSLSAHDDTLCIGLRDPNSPSEAICCLCAPSVDVEVFMASGRDTLAAFDA